MGDSGEDEGRQLLESLLAAEGFEVEQFYKVARELRKCPYLANVGATIEDIDARGGLERSLVIQADYIGTEAITNANDGAAKRFYIRLESQTGLHFVNARSSIIHAAYAAEVVSEKRNILVVVKSSQQS